MRNCNRCYRSQCVCDNTTYLKQIAAPTFIEDIYKWAIENNLFTGTMEEFLEYMKGPQGDSLYEWAVKNGFTTLSKEEWYNQITGTLQYTRDEW